jgi:hypothetical protein
MKDIFFYWTGDEPTDSFADVKQYFPTAKFIKFNDNPVATAKVVAKKALTKQFWLMDIDLVISDSMKNLDLPEWDQTYTHIFSNNILNAYLVPKNYAYSEQEVETGVFNNKKEIVTDEVIYRPYDMFFYWSGITPTHKINHIKTQYPKAKFVELKDSIVATAQQIYKTSLTKQFWLLDIDLEISKSLEDIKIEDWNKQYVHMFINDDISAFLISRDYTFTDADLSTGLFDNKKIVETPDVYYRPYEIYFYWTGVEPTHKFEGVRHLYPTAKFVKYKKNPVNTAREIKSVSRYFWLIDIELVISKELQDTRIPVFDQQYVQVFVNENRRAYLIPSSYQYDHIEFIDGHFSNKKMAETTDVAYRPYDIFFLSYDEESADTNWQTLSSKYSHAKRVHGVKGIFNAHLHAANKSTTDFFWVVDADALVQESFKFDYRVPPWDFDVVHIWNSRNSVNKLEYGYGGIKLIPKFILLMRADSAAVDVTTSIGSKIKLFDEVSNINEFATSPFAAWRAGFREGVKLSSSVISRQNTEESKTRLEVWCHVNVNHPYGEYVKSGAKIGKVFGTKNQHDRDQLALINNYDWLKEKFDEYIMIKKLNQKPLEKSQ